MGADSIQTQSDPKAKSQNVYQFKKPYYSQLIGQVLSKEFISRGYEVVNLASVDWNKYVHNKDGSLKEWNVSEMSAQLKSTSQKFLLSHFFIVGPEMKKASDSGASLKTQGFALYSLGKKNSAAINFKAELVTPSGSLVSRTLLSESRFTKPGAINGSFERAPRSMKVASLDYYKQSLPRFKNLVAGVGLVKRAPNMNVNRTMQVMNYKNAPTHQMAQNKPVYIITRGKNGEFIKTLQTPKPMMQRQSIAVGNTSGTKVNVVPSKNTQTTNNRAPASVSK